MNASILSIKGIGEKKAALFHKLDIETISDLVHDYPQSYEKFDIPEDGSDLVCNERVSIRATISSTPLLKNHNHKSIVTVQISSNAHTIHVIWFHMPFLKNTLKKGETYIFYGLIQKKGTQYTMEHPKYYTEAAYQKLLGSLQPIYGLTAHLSNQTVKSAVEAALANYIGDAEFLPEQLIRQFSFCTHEKALRNIHFPTTMDELKNARARLVFEEFLLFIVNLRMLKETSQDIPNSYVMKDSSLADRLITQLPYQLTNAQLKTYEEIKTDLFSERVMNRLIQGDVGSGKTIVGLLACIIACQNGYQAAFMAPTEVLATQHYETFSQFIKDYQLPIEVSLLTGSTTAKEKKEIYQKLDSGEISLIVGTHALIQDKVSFKELALVITDEQHRFGVKQRERLTTKSQKTAHTIVMSATPIPRTLGIIMYGDLDVSVMNELPAKRLPIKNCVVGVDYRKKAYDFMQKEIEKGRQVYVICPMVEENEEIDAEDVVNYTKKLKSHFPSSVQIDYLHGKMKPAKKQEIMNQFVQNKLQILVSTTVIEVGVNVPNASVMLIENAERFGLAQLHQLRGRIGRGEHQSYCIFLSASDRKEKLERLEILNHSNDGFYIAEEDLKTRGPGDFFGIRQSGLMLFKLGDIFSDAAILQQACDAANMLLERDPTLSSEENLRLAKRLNEFQRSQSELISL